MGIQFKTFVHKTVDNVRQFFRSLITPKGNLAILMPVPSAAMLPADSERSIYSDVEPLKVNTPELYVGNQSNEEENVAPEGLSPPAQVDSEGVINPIVVQQEVIAQAAVSQDEEKLATPNPLIEQATLLSTNPMTTDLQIKSADGAPFTITALLEGLLFVADVPMAASQFARVLQLDIPTVEAGLSALAQSYEADGRGLRLMEHNKKFQLVTVPAFAPIIEEFLHLDASTRLSGPALETLSVIAYRQPVTRMQIEAVRGVDSASVLRSLLQRGLVEEVGRLELAGRPILYGVTDLFMQHFGITKLGELPALEPTEADTLWATTKLAESEALLA